MGQRAVVRASCELLALRAVGVNAPNLQIGLLLRGKQYPSIVRDCQSCGRRSNSHGTGDLIPASIRLIGKPQRS